MLVLPRIEDFQVCSIVRKASDPKTRRVWRLLP